MTCLEAREALLTVEPDELCGAGDTELARHLASCESCARLATALERDLGAVRDLVVHRARRLTRGTFAVGTLVAAAAIVAVMVRRPEAPPAAPEPVNAPVSNVVSVQVAPGQQATVLKTKDPKVTVVWLTPGGGL